VVQVTARSFARVTPATTDNGVPVMRIAFGTKIQGNWACECPSIVKAQEWSLRGVLLFLFVLFD
jgi:hypothetical protein